MQLLLTVPLFDLPDSALNLRRVLLGPYGDVDSALAREVSAAKALLTPQLSFLPPSKPKIPTLSRESILNRLGALKTPAVLEICNWLRRSLVSYVSALAHPSAMADTTSILTLEDFQVLHALLKRYQDFTFLADVLCIFAEYGHLSLHSSVARATSEHIDIMTSIGAAQDIYESLLDRLSDIKYRTIHQKPLFIAMVELARLLPNRKRSLYILELELAVCEPGTVAAACSPLSDSVEETLRGPDLLLSEDLDVLLSNTTSVNSSTISQIFTRVTTKLEMLWAINVTSTAKAIELLDRLRSRNPSFFDDLFLSWFRLISAKPAGPAFGELVARLICCNVLIPETIIQDFLMEKSTTSLIRHDCLRGLLAVLSRGQELCDDSVSVC